MFGLQLTWEEWVALLAGVYLVLRILYGITCVIWWYVTDAQRRTAFRVTFPMMTSLVVAAMAAALTWTLTPNNIVGEVRAAICGVAGTIGFILGLMFDIFLALRLDRVSNWLMAFHVPRYQEQLQTGDTDTRLGAAKRLAMLGAYAHPAHQELFSAFKDESTDVRAAAIEAVMSSTTDPPGDEDADTPKHVRPMLADPDVRVRVYAAALLLRFKTIAPEEALLPLREALKTPADPLAGFAMVILGSMGPAAAPAIPELRDAVLEQVKLNYSALFTLGLIKDAAVPALIEILERGNTNCKIFAAGELGKLGDAALAALPALQKAAANSNLVIKNSAKTAIKKLGRSV